MLDLPEQFLDLAFGGLGVQPGQPGTAAARFQDFRSIMEPPKTFEEYLRKSQIKSFCSANVLVIATSFRYVL